MTRPVQLPVEYTQQRPAPIVTWPNPITIRKNADNTGACTIRFTTVPDGQRWWVDYLTVTAAAGGPKATAYLNDETDPTNLFDLTPDAAGALAGYTPPRPLQPGETLIVVFAGAQAGARCSARLEHHVESL